MIEIYLPRLTLNTLLLASSFSFSIVLSLSKCCFFSPSCEEAKAAKAAAAEEASANAPDSVAPATDAEGAVEASADNDDEEEPKMVKQGSLVHREDEDVPLDHIEHVLCAENHGCPRALCCDCGADDKCKPHQVCFKINKGQDYDGDGEIECAEKCDIRPAPGCIIYGLTFCCFCQLCCYCCKVSAFEEKRSFFVSQCFAPTSSLTPHTPHFFRFARTHSHTLAHTRTYTHALTHTHARAIHSQSPIEKEKCWRKGAVRYYIEYCREQVCPRNNRPDIEVCTCFKGCLRAWTYHFGSILVGAFLIAIVQTARVVMLYVEKQVKATMGKKKGKVREERKGKDGAHVQRNALLLSHVYPISRARFLSLSLSSLSSLSLSLSLSLSSLSLSLSLLAFSLQVVEYIFKVIQGILWVFEQCLKFITANTYIMVAMRDLGFARASASAFGLLLSNVFVLGLVKIFSFVVILIGKIIVVSLSVGIALLWMQFDPIFSYDGLRPLNGTLFQGKCV